MDALSDTDAERRRIVAFIRNDAEKAQQEAQAKMPKKGKPSVSYRLLRERADVLQSIAQRIENVDR